MRVLDFTCYSRGRVKDMVAVWLELDKQIDNKSEVFPLSRILSAVIFLYSMTSVWIII